MADAVKRIGIQFILENIKDVSKTLKEIGQDNKVQLSVEFKDKKTIKNAMSKLNEELSSNFAEGINIGSLLGDALATGNLREAVNNVNALKEALSLLNKQIGVSGDAFKSKIASLNNQQVAELLQASSAIDKNSEIKNKQEAIQNKIDAFSVKGNLELTQKIEQSLDKISNNIEAIRKVTDDIGKGKIGEVLNEQAKGFDKVKESAEGASEAFEEYNNKQIEFNQSGGTEKGKKGKAKNSTNNTQPVTPTKVPAGRDTSSQLDEEEGQVNRIQIVLEKYNNALNLSRVKKDNTLIQKFDSENKAITENIKLLQEEGYTLEVISKIYPKLIRGYTLWQEAQKNKEGKTSSATSTSINEPKTETKLLSGLGKRDAVDKTKDEVDNMQQNLRRATNLEEYTQRYNESSIKIEQLKKELIELGIETEKINNIFKEIKTPQVWEESRKQAEAYRLEQERIKKEEAEKNKSEDSKPKIKARIKRRILPLPSEIEKKSSIQNEQSDINQKAIDKITERANIIKNKLETKTENYDPIVQKKYAERYEEEKESIEQLKKELEELGTESSKIEEILSRIRKPDEWNKIAREVREARKNSLVDQTEIDAIGDKFIGDSVQRTVGMSTEAQRHVEDDFSNETAKTIKSEEGIVSNLEIENEELNEVINRLVESNNTLSQMVIGNINFNATNLASEYKNATQTIQNNMDEYYRLIEETEQEVDFEKLGLTNIDEDGNILDSAKNKIIENVKQKITNINGELGQIKDPTEFQKKYESLQSLITNIKGLLSSLEVKDIDGLFGSDNFNLEKALEIRKKALEQIEKEREKVPETSPAQTQRRSNIVMMDNNASAQAYSTDAPVQEQQKLENAVNETTEALEQQAEVSAQTSQIVANNAENGTKTEEQAKFIVGGSNYIPIITEGMNEANKDLAKEIESILKIYAESRGIKGANDKAKEYIERYFKSQDIIAGYKEDFKEMSYTDKSGNVIEGAKVLETGKKINIQSFAVTKILDFYKELTEITDIINSQESSEEDITQAKVQAENIKGKILGLVDIYTSYGGKDLVDRLTTELGKDSFIDEGSLEQITNTFQTFINEIIIEKDKIRNLGEQVKNIIAQKSNLGSNEDIRDTSAYTGEVYNLTDILNRKYGINLTGKAAERERQMITSLFPQAKSTTRFFGEEDIEGQKIFEEIKKILIETIEKALNSSKTSEAKKQQYKEYLKALRQEGNEAAQEAVARTQESSSQQSQKDSIQLTPQPTPTEVVGSAVETVKAVTEEGSAAETASVQFNDLTEAKKAFALANQEAKGSAEATAEAVLAEGSAAETASATMEGAIKKGQEILEKLKQNNTNIKILSPKDVLDNTSSIASTITEVKRRTNSTRGISKAHFMRNENEDVPEAKIAKSTEMAEDTLQKSLALLATNPIDFSTLLNEAEEKLNTINQLKDIVKVFQGKETKIEGLKGLSEEDLVDKIREEMNIFLDNRRAIDTALIDLEKGEEVDLQAKIIEYRKSQIRVQKMMQQLINKNGGKTDAEGNKRTYLQATEDMIDKYFPYPGMGGHPLFDGYLYDEFENIYNPATDKFRSAEEIGLQIFNYNKEDFNNLQEYYGNLKKIIDYITEHQSEIIAKAVELNNALQSKGLKEEKSLASQPQSSNQISEKNQPAQITQPAQERTQPVLASTPVVQAREDVGQIEGEAEQIKNETEQAKAEAEQARIEAEQARRMAEQAERTAKRTLAILDKINSIRNEIASKRTKGTQLDLNTVIAKKNKIAESIRDLGSKKTIQEIASSSLNPKDISTLKVQNSRDEIESDIQAQLSKEGVLEILKSLLQSKQDELAPMEERMKSFTQSLNESKLKGVSKLTSDELIKQIDASLETMRGLYDNDQRESQDFLFEQLKVVQLIRQMYNRGYGKKELGVGNDKEAVQKILSDLYYEGKIKADESTIGLMSDFKNIGNKRTGTFKSYDAIINDTIAKEYGGSIQQKQNDIADLITIINYIESHLTNLSEMRQVLESGNITKLPTDNLQKYEEQKQKELEVASQNQPKNQTAEVVEQSRESAEQANAIVEQAKQTAEQVLSIWDKINEIKNTIASGRNLDSQLTFNDILTDSKKRKGIVESIKGLDSKETIKEMVDSGMKIREISDYHTQKIQGSRDEIENDIQAQLSKEGLLALLKSTLKSRQDKVASMEQYLDNVRQSFNDSKIKGISKLSLDELIKQIDASLSIMREMYDNDEQGSQNYLFEQLKVAQSIRQMYTRGYGKKEIGAENDKEAIQKILTYLFEEGRIEADKSTIGLMSDFRNIGNESTNNLMSNEGIIKKQNSKQFAYIAQAKDEMADLITIIDYIESHLDSISAMRSILEFGDNTSKQQDTTQTADVVEQSKESAKQAEIIVEEARQTAERTLAIWDKINEIRNTIASGRTLDSQLTFTDITNEENGINRIGNTIKSLKSAPSVQDIVKSGVNINAITEEMVRNSREEIERELNAQLSNEDLLGFFKTALKRRQNTAPNIESNINSFIEDFNNAKIEGVSKKSSDELIKQIDDSLRIMGELYDNNQQKSQDFVFEQLKIVQSIRQLYKKGYDKGSLYANSDEEATQKILNNLYEEGKIGADINTVSLMSRYFNNVGNSKTGNFATYDEMINKQVGQDMKSLQNVMEEISNLITIIDYIENHLASLSTARRFLESGNAIKLPTDNLQKYQEEQKREEERRKREEQEREEKKKRQEEYNNIVSRMDEVEGGEKQDSKDSWERYKQQEKIQKEREAEREKLRKQEEAENKARIAEERRREEQAFNEDTKTATNFYKQLISSEEKYLKLLQQEREGKLNPKENGELTDAQKKNRLKLAEYRKMRETDENDEYLALNEIQGEDWRKVSDVNNLRKEYQTKKENLHQAGYMTDEEAEIAKVNAAYQVLIKTQEQYLRLRTKEKDGQTLIKKEANDLQKLAEERKKAWGAINETKKNNPSAFENETVKTKQSQYVESKAQAKQAVDNSKIIEEISSLYDKMYKARNELSKLVSDSMVGKGDSDAIKKKQQEIDEYTKKIHEATEALRENEALYQQAQDVKLYYEEDENGEFKRRNNVNTPSNKLTSNLQSTFTNLTGLYQEYSGNEYIHQREYLDTLEQQAERIAEILVDIKNNPIDITKKEDLKRLQEYNEELTQMDAKIKKDKKEASGFKQANGTKLARNITDFLSKNHGISEEASTTLRGQLTRLDNGVNIKELKEVGQIYEDIKRQEIEAGRTGMTFFDTLKQRAQGLTATLATYVSFWKIISTVKQGFNTFKQFDSALAEMQKVSNETIGTLKEFQQASFDLADSIGTDALSLQQSVAEFMRLGQSLEEATDSAQAANILFNVSEFESAKDASTALIAMSQAYDELSNTQIIDVINKLGNDFPISTEGLATALQDGAASLTTAGNDFYEAAALVTAGMILCLRNMETYFYRTHLIALIT